MPLTDDQKKDPEHCPHPRVNRVLDSWKCTECGAPFKPVYPKHMTKWPL